MRQFDVHHLGGGGLAVVLQSGFSGGLSTCVIAPLIPQEAAPLLTRLHVDLVYDGSAHLLQIDRLAAVPRKMLGPSLASVSHEQDRIKRALDLLFFGI